MEKGKGKREGEGIRERKGEGKREGKGKVEGRSSLRNVGCTDARTLGWFYTLSNVVHCIGQTTSKLSQWQCHNDSTTSTSAIALLSLSTRESVPCGSGAVCWVSWKMITAGHRDDTSMLSDWNLCAADFNSAAKWRLKATEALPRNWNRSLCSRSARVRYMITSDTANTYTVHSMMKYQSLKNVMF